MISSFFNKAKPIHFLIVSTILFLAFVLTKAVTVTENISFSLVSKQLFLFGVCLLSVFIFDFFVSKNNLTNKSSYHILFFVLFMIIFPQVFLNSKIVIANLFILFALRRIISLRTKKQIKKKLFDAAFWICLASLLYFWAILFFALIFIAIFLYNIIDFKNIIIPFIGMLTVGLIGFSILIFWNIDIEDYLFSLKANISFDFSNLNSQGIIVASTIVFSYFIWASIFYLRIVKTKPKNLKPSFILIFIATIIALIIIVISDNKTGAEFVFLFAPLAIILANYLEHVSEKWFKEILIWILIVAPFATLLL